MNLNTKHPIRYVLNIVLYGLKSLSLALVLLAVLKLAFSDGGWINYVVLSAMLISVLFLGQLFFKRIN